MAMAFSRANRWGWVSLGVLGVTACSGGTGPTDTARTQPVAAAGVAAALTTNDAQPPALGRVASKLILGDELLWNGGEPTQSLTVAVSGLADDPRYSVVAKRWPAALPRLGSNPEQVLALQPEMVLMANFTAEEYRAAVSRHLNILDFGALTGFDAYRSSVRKLAEALQQPALATDLLATFDRELRELEELRARAAGRDRTRWPTCMAWQYNNTAGGNTTFHDACEAGGCRNRAAMGGVTGHRRVDVEQMAAWAPDYIVINCGEAGCDAARREFSARPGFRRLPAVLEERIVAIDPPYMSTTGAGMLQLARRIHDGVYGKLPVKTSGAPQGADQDG
ncbi:MAG: ABC transporter substrate-binding protein [Myxococcales bacterium FL481]|nr:MAG: ABC transporter substrate-binding protein [Myxococcales bacterium FL481]